MPVLFLNNNFDLQIGACKVTVSSGPVRDVALLFGCLISSSLDTYQNLFRSVLLETLVHGTDKKAIEFVNYVRI